MQGFCNLPRDLFLEIFLRLPVDALIRFKSVCKSWYAFINSPNFISMHLNYNRHNNELVLIKRCLLTCFGKKENVFSLVSRRTFSPVNIGVDLLLCKKEPYLQVLGHCDGIICVSNYRDDVVLCNPATKESMVVPKSCLPCYYSSEPSLIPQTNALGFGYDLKNQQYKVVRIVSYWGEFGDNLPQLARVEVHILGTDSWREIKNIKVPAYVQYSPCFETYYNGSFHWHAVDYTNNEVILSFNMGDEKFRVIAMPDFLSKHQNSISKSLLVWNNCLALVTFPGKGVEQEFQICVMENYGVKESWTRKLSIGPLEGVAMPLMFWKNVDHDDKILMEGSDGQAVSYNITTKEINNLQLFGVPKSFQALDYVNSLVSIRKKVIKLNA